MREKIQTPLAERAKSEGYALIKPDELQNYELQSLGPSRTKL